MKSSLFKSSPCRAASLVVALLIILAFALVLVVYLSLEFLSVNLSFGTMQLIGVFGFFGFVFLVFGLSIVGITLAFASFYLREERPLLAVLALILNGVPFLLMALIRYF